MINMIGLKEMILITTIIILLLFGCTSNSETLSVFHLQSKLDQVPIECRANIYNCDDFATQKEAQEMLLLCGQDIHKLDRDKDGVACEWVCSD